MATFKHWAQGARPATLPLAICPILIGCSTAIKSGDFSTTKATLCLFIALSLQVGVNYANDYSDGIRGTDNKRLGPLRLTATKIAPAKQVKLAALISFGIATIAGLMLTFISQQWILIPLGITCLLAAWYYTGGKNPYGYLALGEISVFIFFGIIATLTTSYILSETINTIDIIGATSIGLLSCAVLMVNNIRDIPTDKIANKKTLALILGDKKARTAYAIISITPFILTIPLYKTHPAILINTIGFLATIKPIKTILNTNKTGIELIPALKATSLIAIIYSATFSIGIII